MRLLFQPQRLVFERPPACSTCVGFFTDRPQKGNPGQRSHMRGFDQPHSSLMRVLWSLAAAGFLFFPQPNMPKYGFDDFRLVNEAVD